MLWFAAPPVDIVHVPPPRHSLAYLAHLARKRKAAMAEGEGDGAAMEVDGEGPTASKRGRMPLTATATLAAVLREHGMLEP